ncbi:MAG: hypothetical protein H8E29_11275 [Anaerolineales bacterium]|uniref:Uncharacterized protein n=1 Tax=Candidatus Desulfolinea nitratireducens TaxID=2841698 RepID=A0A8J6NI75_9CHLR|nr:hypothetical protein [Candidatus Desulfolinea nitratireducens]
MNIKKPILPLMILILGAMILISCGGRPERSRKPSNDWGRGLPLGTDATGTVGMVVEEDGATIHAVWPFWAEEGGIGIRYVQLGKAAEIQVDQVVVQTQGQVRTPQLFIAKDESLHLLWANRPDTAAKWQLWYAQFDHKGNIQGELLQVSDANSGVSQYAVVEGRNGGILVAWEDILSGGIKLTEISILGEKQANPKRVVEAGVKPDLWVDERGKIHLAWLDNDNNLLYARTDADVASPLSGEKLLRIPLGTGATLDGPVLGVVDGNVYIFWSVLSQSGLEAGTARTEYVFFPQGSPDKVSDVTRIDVLPLEEQPYRTDRGSYAYTELVPATYISNTSPYVYAPMVIQHPTGEMAIALATRQQYRLDGYVQIAVVVMENGAYKGYTIATKTQAISSDPVLDADGAGNLHLIWRDGYSKEIVYYTTTDAETRAELDRPTIRDILTLVLAGGLESLTGILLFPLAFPWMFPGLIVLIIWRLIRNDEDLSNKVSVALLVLSVLMYQGSKILIFPTMVDYIPFSAWVDIPASWQMVLRIGVPLLILGIAIWASEWSRKNQQPSSLRYYLVIVIVDTVLTLAIYGVNFLGAY